MKVPVTTRLLTASVGLLLSVGSLAVLAPTTAHAGTAHITVTPSTGLKNGENVEVSGSGYPAGQTQIAIGECEPDPTGPSQCFLAGGSEFVTANASGSWGPVSLKVDTTFNGYDCTTKPCYEATSLITTGGNATKVKAQTAISFASTSTGGTGTNATTTPTPTPATTPSTAATTSTTKKSKKSTALPFTGPVPGAPVMLLLAGALMILGCGIVLNVRGRSAGSARR